MATFLLGTPAISYVNDLIVGGTNKIEHDNNLHLVPQRLTFAAPNYLTLDSLGMHVNARKMQTTKSHMIFLGHDTTSITIA